MKLNSALGKRAASGLGWAASGTGGQTLFQIVALVVLARWLSPAEFGVVSAATIVTQLSQILNEFGIGPAIVQRKSLNEGDIRVGFSLSCLFGVVVIGVLWSTSPVFAEALSIPELTWVIRAYTATFLMKSFSTVAESLLHREMRFRLLARAETISFAFGYAGLGILCAIAGLSYWSIVIAHLGQAAIKASMVLKYRAHSKYLSFKMDTVREFVHFGAGQSLSRLGSYVANQGDSFVVAKSLGVEKLGEYGRANQLVVMPGHQLGAIFDKVLFPTFSLVQGEKHRFGAAYRRALTMIAMLGIPASGLLFVMTPEYALILLGNGWGNVIEPMQILALGLVFRLIHKISDPTARAAGAVYERAWRQILVGIVVVAGAYTGTNFGLRGVACGVLIATSLDALLMMHLCSRIAGLTLKTVLLDLAPGLRLGIATYFIALCVHATARLMMDFPLGILMLTVASTALLLTFLVYVFPKVSLGRPGIDAVAYVWSLLNIRDHYGLRAPST